MNQRFHQIKYQIRPLNTLLFIQALHLPKHLPKQFEKYTANFTKGYSRKFNKTKKPPKPISKTIWY